VDDDHVTTPADPDPEPTAQSMPPWIKRAILWFFLGVIGLAAGSWLLSELKGFLITLLVAFVVALALETPVNSLARRGVPRAAGAGIVFLVIALVVLAFLAGVGALFVQQLIDLGKALPAYAQEITDTIERQFDIDLQSAEVRRSVDQFTSFLPTLARGVAGQAFGIATGLVGLLFQAFTAALFTWYFVTDGPRLRRFVCSRMPPRYQREVLRAWGIAVEKTGQYVISRFVLAVCSALATWLFLTIIGLPYAVVQGVFVGLVSQFVPTVGTYIAGALPVIVALLEDPQLAIVVLIFIIVYQQIENYLLQPRITSLTVSIHPAVAFGAVIAGGALLGGVGAILAIPVYASVAAFAENYSRKYSLLHDPLLSEVGPLPAVEAETISAAEPR
jgi:predicted PurR-regulated permease PerM